MRFFSPRACKFYGTIAGILLACSSAWGQAKVNENLETASIYVDVKVGSDSNPGTQTAPFKTIGAPPPRHSTTITVASGLASSSIPAPIGKRL